MPPWTTAEALEAMVHAIIASGRGTCMLCELPLTDPDAKHVVAECQDCGGVEIYHEGCASPEVRKIAGLVARRTNWRWN